jgi:hypothetical protein
VANAIRQGLWPARRAQPLVFWSADGGPVHLPRRIHGVSAAVGTDEQLEQPAVSIAKADNIGWSIYGVERSQPVATGGKWDGPENASNSQTRCRGLRPVA